MCWRASRAQCAGARGTGRRGADGVGGPADADPAGDALSLPANVQAWADAPIYARTNGYLRRRLVDIGARVKQGQLLAEIDTPEVTQQIAQSEAMLATAQAADQLAQSTATRWSSMLATDSVARQDVDEKLADAAAKRSALAAARADLNRLRQLGQFQRIVAPFDGIITARSTDVGALVTAGSGPAAGAELFHIQDVSRLRVYVNVPQAYAPAIQVGGGAMLHIAELPGKSFPARVVSTAGSLDPASRTLLTQLEVDNAAAAIRPGSYGEVDFALAPGTASLRIPSNCLLFRGEGLQVATLDGGGRITVKSVNLGRDFGKDVEVLEGLAPADRVVLNPPDSIRTGMLAQVARGRH
ncbi:MAG: efflux RND transporter periplasmic adaptor subunit [Steroidobacteraceae bacterium]